MRSFILKALACSTQNCQVVALGVLGVIIFLADSSSNSDSYRIVRATVGEIVVAKVVEIPVALVVIIIIIIIKSF